MLASISVRSTTWQRPARLLALALPVVMMVAGILLAFVAAHRQEQPESEGLGTLGVELGAALWFAAAVSLGIQNTPTILRGLALLATGATGLGLIAVALVRDWTGPGLTLAMEFGVGALAVSLIDVVLLGMLHSGVSAVANGPDDVVVRIGLVKSWHVIDVRVERLNPAVGDGAGT